jgi:hypothetical protein
MTRYGGSALWTSFLSTMAFAVAGCAAVEGIFKAGVWVGILVVVCVAALIALTTGTFRGR